MNICRMQSVDRDLGYVRSRGPTNIADDPPHICASMGAQGIESRSSFNSSYDEILDFLSEANP
jgi:hypothetical protein